PTGTTTNQSRVSSSPRRAEPKIASPAIARHLSDREKSRRMTDEDEVRLARRGRRIGSALLVLASVVLFVPGTGAWIAFRRQASFGTIWADKAPPKIARCGREWHKGGDEEAAPMTLNGLVQVDTTPGGRPILALQSGCSTPTPTVVWVRLAPDRFIAYSLSGGP